MSLKTSFRLTGDALKALDALRAGLHITHGRVAEFALTRMEADWRKGALKKARIQRGEKSMCCILMTHEAIASLDRLESGLSLSRTEVLEMALRRLGKEWAAGKIRGIGLLVG